MTEKFIKQDDGIIYLTPTYVDKLALAHSYANHASAEVKLIRMKVAHDQQAYEVRKMKNEAEHAVKQRALVQLEAEYNTMLKETAEELNVSPKQLSYDSESGQLSVVTDDGYAGPLRWNKEEEDDGSSAPDEG